MKSLLALLFAALLLAGAAAQPTPSDDEKCDPETSGTALVDLAEDIGKLACKVPNVNLTAVMSGLTGTLGSLTLDQLKQLPGLLDVLLSVNPSALTPFLSLSSTQLTTLLPLFTQVPSATLTSVFPLLAKQSDATVVKMVKFLQQVPRSKLEQVGPVFSRVTEGQIKLLLHLLDVMPAQSWDLLIGMVQGLGPVTDSILAAGDAKAVAGVPFFGNSRARVGAVQPSLPFAGLVAGKARLFGGRRLMAPPAATPAPAAAPAAEACDPAVAGIEVGVALLGDFGVVVCKFGADNLRPVLKDIIAALVKQNVATLSALPQLTSSLSTLDANAFSAFFAIPQSSLGDLVPLVSTLPTAKVQAQLQLLGSQQPSTIDNMVYFLKSTPVKTIEMMIPLFSELSDQQLDIAIRATNALSPGQIRLTIHLLSTFGGAIDAIGRSIPARQSRGNSFMIGPIRVTVGGAPAARHPILPFLG